MSTKFVWLELSEKIWPLLKSRSMILSSMTQTIEKWGCHVLGRIDFWMVLRAHGTPWFHFYFLFRTNVRKGYLDESVFRHCYDEFFESSILEVTWSRLCSKLLLKNCETHSKQHFERNPTVEGFSDMDQDAC